MRFTDQPAGVFFDRNESGRANAVDVLMLTLDAESFLNRCLYSVYKEVPVNRLFVCDGGSKDNTLEILGKYPRVRVFSRPDIRTTGKAMEFLLSKVETEWLVLLDADIELPSGWYDEMCRHKAAADMIENSRRFMGYHLYREDTGKLGSNARPYDFCHLGRKESVRAFKCDDDFVWGMNDIFLRDVVERSNGKYVKVADTYHLHHTTEEVLHKSDIEKSFRKLTFKEPQWQIVDKGRYEKMLQKFIFGLVKYVDPNEVVIRGDRGLDELLVKFSRREWVAQNGPEWLARYDKASSLSSRLRWRVILLYSWTKARIPSRLKKARLVRSVKRQLLQAVVDVKQGK